MKAILEFQLPEEQIEFDIANSASGYHSTLWGLDEKLRGQIKHGHGFKDADEALAATRQLIHDLMEENDVKFQD